MKLYLVRHGEAESFAQSRRDEDRKLTPEGKQNLANSCKNWPHLIKGLVHIVSSPKVRAYETAKIIKEAMNHQAEIIIDKRLSGIGSTEDVIELVNSLKADSVMIVGHEPDFSEYVSDFVSNSGVRMNFKKGMLVKVSFNAKARIGGGTLEYILPLKVYL